MAEDSGVSVAVQVSGHLSAVPRGTAHSAHTPLRDSPKVSHADLMLAPFYTTEETSPEFVKKSAHATDEAYFTPTIRSGLLHARANASMNTSSADPSERMTKLLSCNESFTQSCPVHTAVCQRYS